VIPALAAALIATVTATFAIPNLPTYSIPAYEVSVGAMVWALITAPIFALFSVLFVRAIAWADRNRPTDWLRFVAPIVVLTSVGLISIPFPQVLGNGKDITQILFSNQMPLFPLVLLLLVLRPAATVFCFASGAPGGLFTPTLAAGALLGSTLGFLWLSVWPGAQPGLFALIGAAATLAATTQGPSQPSS
jgi:chloride channel protein, CIC family